MVGFVVFGAVLAIVLATSLIKNVQMSDKVKNLIAVVLSTFAGVIIDLQTHGFDFGSYALQDVLGTVLVIYGASQAVYNFILKGTALEEKLENVEVIPVKEDEEVVNREGF
jgi:hypothetical protein